MTDPTTSGRPGCPDLDSLAQDPYAPGVTGHIGECMPCRVVADLLRERRRAEHARDRRAECAKFELLIAARDGGSITPPAARLLDAHLRSCAECTAAAVTSPPLHDTAAAPSANAAALQTVPSEAYALGREIARGGMGRILVAEDLRIGRRVAVKEVLDTSRVTAQRFEREARVTARLQHPGIVPIYEMGRWPDGAPFYAMRLVEGETLYEAARTKQGLGERLALLPAVIAATEAVAFAHSHDVIHRDLTPRNILVGAYGDTVVIDWGLAKDLGAKADADASETRGPYRDIAKLDNALTSTGAVVGTASYMPPEQAAGDPVDKRADVYALGAILYQLIASAPPYNRNNSADVLGAIKRGPPAPLESIVPEAPRELASIVRKAMAREPADRYPDAAGLARELRRYQTGLVVESHYYSRPDRMRRWFRKHRVLAIATLTALLVIGTVGSLALSRVLAERTRAERGERDAIAQRQAAERTNNTLLEEQGRQELLRGNKLRALAYLDEAYRRGADSVALRVLLAAATRELGLRERTLPCGGLVTSIVVDTAEQRVAAACGDVGKIWRIDDGTLLATLGPMPGAFWRIKFSGNGSRVVTWGTAGTRVWDAATGSLLATFDGDPGSAAISADGSIVSTGATDGKVRVWNVATGALQRTFTVLPKPGLVGGTLLSNDRVIAAGEITTGDFVFYDLPTGARLGSASIGGRLLDGDVRAGRLVLCGRDVRVWDQDSRQLVATLSGHTDLVLGCELSPDGSQVLSSSADGTAKLWDIASGRALRTFQHGGNVKHVAFSADGQRVVTVNGGSGSLNVWTTSGALLAVFEEPSETADRAFAFVGDRVITETDDGALQVWRLGGLVPTSFTPPHDERVVPASDDAAYGITTGKDGTVHVWNARERRRLEVGELREPFTVFNGRLAAVGPDGDVRILDVASGTEVRRLHPSEPVQDLRLTWDGRRLAITLPSAPEIWDVEAGVRVWRMEGMTLGALDERGTNVVAWKDPQRVEVWNVDDNTRRATFQLDRPAELLELSHDSARVVMQNRDRLALWDVATQRRVLEVTTVMGAGVDPTGHFVAATGQDGVVRTWRIADAALMASFVAPGLDVMTPSPDGELLAVGVFFGAESRVVSARDGRILARWPIVGRDYTTNERDVQATIAVPTWTRDGTALLGRGAVLERWEVPRESRTPAAFHEAVRTHLVWEMKAGELARITRRLRGYVRRKGAPVRDAVVLVDRDAVARLGAVGKTDASGAFSIDLPSVRTYQVAAQLDNVAFSQPRSVECQDVETVVDIELDLAGAIVGRVIGDDGKPRGGVRVTAYTTDDEGQTVTAADGNFTIGALAGQRAYELHVYSDTGLELPASVSFPHPRVANGSDTVRGVDLVIDSKGFDLDLKRRYHIVNVENGKALAASGQGTMMLVPRASAPVWKLTPLDRGYVRFTLVAMGDEQSLDGDHMAPSGAYSGQAWRLRHEGDAFRLSNAYQTDANSLDGSVEPVRAAPTADRASQRWQILAVPDE
jgi:eukaryotic-like serine/threonine-protein kinase